MEVIGLQLNDALKDKYKGKKLVSFEMISLLI
jgi:hypothetical protein